LEVDNVFGSSRKVVLADHLHLLDLDLVSLLDCAQLRFQFLDVLLPVELHLLHDFLLGVDLTLQVLLLGKGIVELVLEVLVLLGEDLIRLSSSLKFYLNVLGKKHLIL
jgi:hypothetical protein